MRASVCVCLAASAGCAGSGVHEHDPLGGERVTISDELYVDALTNEPVYAMARPPGIVVFQGPARPDQPAAVRTRELVASDLAALLRRGASFADAFERGDGGTIWNAFGERAKKASDSDAFERLVDTIRSAIGRRVSLRGEYVMAAGHGVAFLRNAVYERAPKGIVVEVSFAPDGKELTDFATYAAEARPIRLKKVEDGHAAR